MKVLIFLRIHPMNSYGFLTVYNLPLIVLGDSSYMVQPVMDRMSHLFHLVVDLLEIPVGEHHKDNPVGDSQEQKSMANVNPLVYQHQEEMFYP